MSKLDELRKLAWKANMNIGMDDLEKEIRRLYSFPNSNNTDIIAGLLLSMLFRIQKLEEENEPQ